MSATRGLRERVIPAQHLQTEPFLSKWKKLCVEHGLGFMRVIIEEEKRQLVELKAQIEESAISLEPHSDKPDFFKLNELLKKEIEKVQKNLKLTKQSKFQRDLDDWATGDVFDYTVNRGRSSSKRRWYRSHSSGRGSYTSQSDQDKYRSVTFLEEETPIKERKTPSRGILKPTATQRRNQKENGKGGGGDRNTTREEH